MHTIKHTTIAIIITFIILIGVNNHTHAYTFGMLSSDDTSESIKSIEQAYNIRLPMVSFIRDGYGAEVHMTLAHLSDTLGLDRIYHITLSPELGPENIYTSAQVLGGHFDREYEQLFKTIKRSGIKVVFRTMHEMNGGWYPWSGDPTTFKQARIRIHKLSREVGLDQSQILFDFSVNGWDMPVVDGGIPHQGANLIECSQSLHRTTGCLTWENYYPGDEYVDVMGVTFYNRGKATSDRQRLTPGQIMDEPRFDIWNRLVTRAKPIIIDEVGTTSIRYQGSYDRNKSVLTYEANEGAIRKNIRLQQLASRAGSKPELVALNYFNIDRTRGLIWNNPGEADRSAIDLDHDRYYPSIMELYKQSDNDLNSLFTSPQSDQTLSGIKIYWDSPRSLIKTGSKYEGSSTGSNVISSGGNMITGVIDTSKQLDKTSIYWD